MTDIPLVSEASGLRAIGRRVGRRPLIMAAPPLAVAIANVVPGLFRGPVMDAAVFMTSGWLIGQGRIPYLGIWDHKPPMTEFLNAIGSLVVPADPWAASWMISLVLVVATSFIVASIVHHALPDSAKGGLAPVVAGTACALGLSVDPISSGGGLSEIPAVFFGSLAVALALGSSGPRRAALVGMCLAAAVSSSLLAVALVPVTLLVWRGVPLRKFLGSAAAAAGGGLLVGLATVSYLIGVGALGSALDQLVRYNAAYGALNASHLDTSLAALLTGVFVLAALWMPALASISSRRTRLAGVWLVSVAWLLGIAAAVAFSRHVEPHYFALVVPPLAALLGVGVAVDLRRVRLAAVVGLGISVATLGAWWSSASGSSYFTAATAQRAVATYVSEHVPAGAPIYVWGDAPGIYAWSERKPAGPYTYSFPLITPGYSTAEQVNDLLDAWLGDPPRLVVDAGGGGPSLLRSHDVYQGDGRDLDILQPLRRFVADRYGPPSSIAGLLVYPYVGP